MRLLVFACLLAGCHAQIVAPPQGPPIAAKSPKTPVAQVEPPPPASTLSFLERTSPPGAYLDVPHAEVIAKRREGAEAIDDQLAEVSSHMRECYMAALEYSNITSENLRENHLTMTIDPRPSGTLDVDVQPEKTPRGLAACLVQALIRGHLKSPARIVLAVDAWTWFTPR